MLERPLEQFEIFPLIPFRLGRFDFSFRNSAFFMVLRASLVIILVQLIAVDGNGSLVPRRWQMILESVYKLLLDMVTENIGEKGRQYFGFILAFFVFILTCNLVGLVPYSFTVTSHLVVTLTMSLAIWVGKLIIGLRYHGFKLLSIFLPRGAPFAMTPFFVVLEMVGFTIPVISLAVRLFANMMAGHILLKVLAGFAWTMMMAGGILFVLHFLPLGVLFVLMGLETAVAFIQAYVFTLLTCLYIGDMIHGGH